MFFLLFGSHDANILLVTCQFWLFKILYFVHKSIKLSPKCQMCDCRMKTRHTGRMMQSHKDKWGASVNRKHRIFTKVRGITQTSRRELMGLLNQKLLTPAAVVSHHILQRKSKSQSSHYSDFRETAELLNT